MRATKRRFEVNLHNKKLNIKGTPVSLRLCSTCIRTMNKDQVSEKDIKELQAEK